MSLTKVSYSMITGAAVNVLDYGADKTGVADSASAIQAAITAGNEVWFPTGTYRIDTAVTLKSDLTLLFAAGAKIEIANGIDAYVFQGTSLANLAFVNVTILGNGEAAGFNSVQLNTCSNVLFDNCTIQKSRGTAIQLIGCSFVKVQNCDLSYNYYYGCEDRDGVGNKFVGNLFYSNGDTGVVTGTGGRGLVLWRSHDTYVAGNRFKANTEYGFRIYSASGETSANGIADARIIGNFFSDNEVIDLYCYNESTYVTSVVVADNIIERNQAPSASCVTLSGSNITVSNTHIRSETLWNVTAGFSLYGSTNVTLSDCSAKNIGQPITLDGGVNPQNCVIDNFFGDGMVKVGVVYGAGHHIRNSKFVHAGTGTTDTCLDLTGVSGRVWIDGCLFDGFEYGMKISDAAVTLRLNTTQNNTASGLRKYNNSLAAIELVSNSWTDSAFPSELNNLNKTNSPYDQANGFYPTTPVNLTWTVGDVITNDTPSVGQPKGWVCTVAGTPGTWVSVGNL